MRLDVSSAQLQELEVILLMARLGELNAEHLDLVRGASKARRDDLLTCLSGMYVHLTLASRTMLSNAVMSSSGSRNFHGVLWKKVLAIMGVQVRTRVTL